MVFEIRKGNEVILFTFTFWLILAPHNCNSLTRALLLLFNVFTLSDCLIVLQIVKLYNRVHR